MGLRRIAMEVVASTRGTSQQGLWSRTRPSGRWSQATPFASKAERLLSLKTFQYMSDATCSLPRLAFSRRCRVAQSYALLLEVCLCLAEILVEQRDCRAASCGQTVALLKTVRQAMLT